MELKFKKTQRILLGTSTKRIKSMKLAVVESLGIINLYFFRNNKNSFCLQVDMLFVAHLLTLLNGEPGKKTLFSEEVDAFDKAERKQGWKRKLKAKFWYRDGLMNLQMDEISILVNNPEYASTISILISLEDQYKARLSELLSLALLRAA